MRSAVAVVVVGLAMACGGAGKPAGSLAGCWKLSLGGAAGQVNLTPAGDVYDGTFTLGEQTGSAFGVVEPNGNFAVMLSTPDKLLWELTGEEVSEPLTGTAVQQGQAPVALSAPRC